jgi:iron complex outermembrane receptor protein
MNPGDAPGDVVPDSRFLWFSLEDAAAGRLDQIFQPGLGQLGDIDPITSTITNVLEAGYRGTFNDKLLFAANIYRTQVEDFVGPLRIETPSVFLDPATTQAFVLGRLGPAIQGGLVTQEQAAAIIEQLAKSPLGTVVPDNEESTDLFLTFRNFGDFDFWGTDFEVRFLATPEFTVGASYSHVSEKCFDFDGAGDCLGGEDIALNAPQHKGSVMAEWDDEVKGLSVGTTIRFNDAFPMNSGVYVGDVGAYTTVDANIEYRLPWVPGASVSATAYNLLDHRHQEAIGAPEIGRLFLTRLTYVF